MVDPSIKIIDEEEVKEKPKKIMYNVQMAKALRNLKAPYKGVILDVRLRPEWLALVVYEENIMSYNTHQQENIMEWLWTARSLMESFGTRCEIEGIKYREETKLH
jgi:hypothetical protein